MQLTEAKKRVQKLRQLIDHHRYLYHVLDRQEISPDALDALKKELFDLEQKFPQLITLDSPTQRVAGKPLEKFKKVVHPTPMLSFNDAFTKEDMQAWLERISKLLTPAEQKQVDFYCELKIDGLAVELIYRNGLLVTGSTRGDGLIGEDITQNLKTIEAIPLRLRQPKKNRDKELVVRGEVFVSKKEFIRINKVQQAKGLPTFANPRNLAAGSIRQLDPKIAASRQMDFFAYDLLTDFGQTTHEAVHELLKILGFKTNSYNRYCQDLDSVFEFHKLWQGKKREQLPYEIDGAVVIINQLSLFKKLGVVGKAPRAAIAFKFPLKQATTKVLDIKAQVGRTGILTPVAVLEPVEIAGVTVSRATLHNEDEIKRLGVKIGDTVIVGRAGDVIPDIVAVLTELRTEKEKEFKFPLKCVSCNQKISRKPGQAFWRCTNPECPAQYSERFYHFVSKPAFDIVGLGPKIIDRLLAEGLVKDPADIFDLKEDDLLELERFGEKSAQNIINSIQSRRRISLARLIYSLGIPHVGEQTSQDLAKHFEGLSKLRSANQEQLEQISDIGPVVAKAIFEWFQSKSNIRFLDKLLAQVRAVVEKPDTAQAFTGKTFVITGTLPTMTREQAKKFIIERGGRVAGDVSANTDYLVAGEGPGSKLARAERLGVKKINELELRAMAGNK